MPHQFKATPSHPAVAYLVRLHADIGGKILDNKKEAGHLAASMLAVEHVIKIFDPDYLCVHNLTPGVIPGALIASRNDDLGVYYSTLTPLALIGTAHLAISLFTSSPRCCGVAS